jgi:hypothetical protein
MLPIELEALVVKIYKYLHMCTFRISDEADAEYETYCSLESLVFCRYLWKWGIIVVMYGHLKAYFINQQVLVSSFA